ncbi:invertase inhibitor [Canna indica]|uniref:Invertase inhibitor n=1 Tax=Canna indica TaxID=4628 RepID=A0AAQ3KVQ3_9LILI|nr:invertase inhibitor [Canna indica]
MSTTLPLAAIAVFLVLLFHHHHLHRVEATVEDICGALINRRTTLPKYSKSFCVTTLKEDPSSASTADPKSFARIAIKLSLTKGSIVDNKIADLIQNTKNDTEKLDRLWLCRKEYVNMVGTLYDVDDDIKENNIAEVKKILAPQVGAPIRCERKYPKHFTKENIAQNYIMSISYDIIDIFLS